jgi:hypothetical protein
MLEKVGLEGKDRVRARGVKLVAIEKDLPSMNTIRYSRVRRVGTISMTQPWLLPCALPTLRAGRGDRSLANGCALR